MKCIYCNADIDSTANVCPYCGKPVVQVVPQEQVPNAPVEAVATTPVVVPVQANTQQVANVIPVASQPEAAQQPQSVVPASPEPVVQPVVNTTPVPQPVVTEVPAQSVATVNPTTPVVPVQSTQVTPVTPAVTQPVVSQPAANVVPGQTPMVAAQPVVPANTVQPQKKKTPVLLILLIVLLVLGAVGFVGFTVVSKLSEPTKTEEKDKPKKEEEKPDEPEISENRVVKDRVIMVYLIGSNLESQGGAATSDIAEMIESQYNEEDIQILLYVGGTKQWQNQAFNAKENAIYQIKDGDVEKLKTYDVKSMTKASTLTEYLNYVYANYQSDNYGLILWDHGGGPIYGYGSDENDSSGKAMSIIDLDSAINNSSILTDGKLEFLGFDACLMSSVEIANLFKEEAEYFIASSESEPGDGWDYNFLKEINKDTTTEQLGKHIIDYYYNFFTNKSAIYASYGYSYNPAITLSLIDLSKIDNVNTSINSLFANMDSNITVDTYSKIAREASRATLYGVGENGVSQFDLIDLYDFTSELEGYQDLATSVQSAVDDAVIYHRTNIYDCNGLSMYFPSTTKQVYNVIEGTYKYGQLAVSENYKNFLKRYTAISSGDKLIKSDIADVTPNVNNSGIQTTIPDDLATNYQYVDYIVFRKIEEDGSFLPVYKSRDVSVKGNTISATVSDRRIAVTDSEGKEIYDVIAIENSRDKNSITYEIIAALERWEDDDYIGTHESEIVRIYLKVDNKTKKGEIVDIRKSDEEENKTSAKITYNLNEWRTIKYLSYSYKLQDENGKKLDDWVATDTMYGVELTIKDGYNFFATSFDKNSEYYYMFRVQDTQGNIHETNLVKAK